MIRSKNNHQGTLYVQGAEIKQEWSNLSPGCQADGCLIQSQTHIVICIDKKVGFEHLLAMLQIIYSSSWVGGQSFEPLTFKKA